MSSAFAFTALSSKVTNNTSIVLLIGWSGKRLLFVGDTEWNTKFKEGKANGAWNVMWHRRKARLNSPIDFLKSATTEAECNSLERSGGRPGHRPSAILDAILPKLGGATKDGGGGDHAQNYDPILRSALLVELAKQVKNVRNYQAALGANASALPKFSESSSSGSSSKQPWRTNLRTRCRRQLRRRGDRAVGGGASAPALDAHRALARHRHFHPIAAANAREEALVGHGPDDLAVVLGSVGDRETLRIHFLDRHSGLHLLVDLVVAGLFCLFSRVADVTERRPRAHLDDDGLDVAHGDRIADLQVVEPGDLGIDIDGLEARCLPGGASPRGCCARSDRPWP